MKLVPIKVLMILLKCLLILMKWKLFYANGIVEMNIYVEIEQDCSTILLYLMVYKKNANQDQKI